MMPVVSFDDVRCLRRAEVFWIRHLSPTFNVQHASEIFSDPIPSHLLSSWWSDDIMTVASRILRKVHPKLSPAQWVSLLVAVRGMGDRKTAAQLRRVAARLCPSLHTLRSSPRITFPCPMPGWLLRHTHFVFSRVLRQLPSSVQSPVFRTISRCSSAVWRASPYLTSFLAPPQVPVDRLGACSCHLEAGHPPVDGHIITRNWQQLSCAGSLAALLGSRPLQMRVFPSLRVFLDSLLSQVKRQL